MKKLEQAIAYFEDAIRESDEIISEYSEELQRELIEQKAHFVVALESMRKHVPMKAKPLKRYPTLGRGGETMDHRELNRRVNLTRKVLTLLQSEYGDELTPEKARELLEKSAQATEVILNIQARWMGGPREGTTLN